jgi:hypothetical protein
MQLSRRTLSRMLELLDKICATFEAGALRYSEMTGNDYWEGEATSKYWSRLLFEHEFSDWMIARIEESYHFDWDRIVRDLSTGKFFTMDDGTPIRRDLPRQQYEQFGHTLLGIIAAIIVTGEFGPKGPAHGTLKLEPLKRSLEHDGYIVDTKNVKLVEAEGPLSHEEEETRLSEL